MNLNFDRSSAATAQLRQHPPNVTNTVKSDQMFVNDSAPKIGEIAVEPLAALGGKRETTQHRDAAFFQHSQCITKVSPQTAHGTPRVHTGQADDVLVVLHRAKPIIRKRHLNNTSHARSICGAGASVCPKNFRCGRTVFGSSGATVLSSSIRISHARPTKIQIG